MADTLKNLFLLETRCLKLCTPYCDVHALVSDGNIIILHIAVYRYFKLKWMGG